MSIEVSVLFAIVFLFILIESWFIRDLQDQIEKLSKQKENDNG